MKDILSNESNYWYVGEDNKGKVHKKLTFQHETFNNGIQTACH